MATGSQWNPENIRDVAESVGIPVITDDVATELAKDVDFRIGQVCDEALKFMRHGKRTTLNTQDISNALRVLNIEPLYGYESTRPLRFGEASIGPGQPLYYIEDEEVDFEKLINSPLPKVPREITFTAHWLAVEGVQPSIPQNPTTSSTSHSDLLPKGPNANPHLAASNGYDNVTVKPSVKHVLSKESQELFSKISTALTDETNSEWRNAALASLRTDPGIHQLITYLITFFAEKVTHSMRNLFVLTQMMHGISALLANTTLYLDPYIAYIVPPVLTCCIGKHLGPPTNHAANTTASSSTDTLNGTNGTNGTSNGSTPALAHFPLRDLASSILHHIATHYETSSNNLKSRIARTCLKNFLDPTKTLGAHYGALTALLAITGAEGMKVLVCPNLKVYDEVLREALADDNRKIEAEMVAAVILRGLETMERNRKQNTANGVGNLEGLRERLGDKVGEVITDRIVSGGRSGLAQVVLETDVNL